VKNKEQPETIHCNQCGAPAAVATGRFLRPVLVLCGDCRTRTAWHPQSKPLDEKRV